MIKTRKGFSGTGKLYTNYVALALLSGSSGGPVKGVSGIGELSGQRRILSYDVDGGKFWHPDSTKILLIIIVCSR